MKSTSAAEDRPENTVHLHDHAMDNISYIRQAMDRSSQFTGVPGWAMVMVGVLALLGSFVANLRLNYFWWPNAWAATGAVSMGIAIVALFLKARRHSTIVFTAPGKRFFTCFCPPILAGMILTEILVQYGLYQFLPTMWLMLYGVAVLNAGTFSIPIVPIWGGTMFVLGIVALGVSGMREELFMNYNAADICMAAGFGVAHIGFGLVIALRHGG